ncbi:MAG TPA: hypothetical protein EYQ50_02345 [Verrucomicrobiales bacterium]|nr:hypothetical protein [Verrucomicrobiales bacterium]
MIIIKGQLNFTAELPLEHSFDSNIKIVHVGKIEDQNEIRRTNFAQMSPDKRINVTIEQQARFLRWDLHSKMVQTVKLTRLNDKKYMPQKPLIDPAIGCD